LPAPLKIFLTSPSLPLDKDLLKGLKISPREKRPFVQLAKIPLAARSIQSGRSIKFQSFKPIIRSSGKTK
jgi:hypothetical protein